MKAWSIAFAGLLLVAGACGTVEVASDADSGQAGPTDAGAECEGAGFLECRETAALVCEDGEEVETVCDFGCSEALEGCRACAPGDTQCIGDEVVTCDGDGAIEDAEACDLGCFEAEGEGPRCGIVQPTNLPEDVCDEPVVSSEPIAGDIDTDSGCDDVIAQEGDAPAICVLMRDEAVVADGDIRVTGERALAIVGTSSLDVLGRLDASAEGTASGPGAPAERGPGRPGSTDELGVGGGGAGHGGPGGLGAEPDAEGLGGLAGASYGSDVLSPLLGGSRGGRDREFGSSSNGGGGGGAVQLVSCGEVSIGGDAYVHVGGGGGRGGAGSAGSQSAGGAGGGSGGSILIEAAAVEIGGALAANGGQGGQGGCDQDGIDGEDAKPSDQIAGGSVASACSTEGGFGEIALGGTGGARTTEAGDGKLTEIDLGGGGGGGGAAGRIRINTAPGTQADVQEGAVVSPPATEGAVSAR